MTTHPRPTVTDEMVEAAATAIWECADDEVGWKATVGLSQTGDVYMQGQVDFLRRQARAALEAAMSARAEKPVALPPIDIEEGREGSLPREYIPLPGGWELQTKGTGSTYRICDTKTGDRHGLQGMDSRTLDFITRMGKEIRTAYATAYERGRNEERQEERERHLSSIADIKRLIVAAATDNRLAKSNLNMAAHNLNDLASAIREGGEP